MFYIKRWINNKLISLIKYNKNNKAVVYKELIYLINNIK